MTNRIYSSGAGKPMPERVRTFLNQLEALNFEVKLMEQGPKAGVRKTWQIWYGGVWVALTNDVLWTKTAPRLYGYRFPKAGGTSTIAEAPADFDIEKFAKTHAVDIGHLKTHTEKTGKSYLEVRDEWTGWKLLLDWAATIDGGKSTLLFTELVRQQRGLLLRPDQIKLRSDLLELGAPHSCCAISGETEKGALEAAHLIDHARGGVSDARNAIILRSDLHALFDSGKVRIDANDGTIQLLGVADDSRYHDDSKAWQMRLHEDVFQRVRCALGLRSALMRV